MVRRTTDMVATECAYPGCDFQSENDSEAIACARLQSHAFLHASVPAQWSTLQLRIAVGLSSRSRRSQLALVLRIGISSLIAGGFSNMDAG